MNSKSIELFITSNIQNFRLNGVGWKGIIEKMLFEFCIAGWDLTMPVGGKEKFGGLRCYVDLKDKTLEERIKGVINKYAAIAAVTCEQCGGTGKKRVNKHTQWETTLCKECYFKDALQHVDPHQPTTDGSALTECKICGYISVTNDHCGFCHHPTYSSDDKIYSPSTYYDTEEDYIKEAQIELFLDEDNTIELNKKLKHYSKSDTHQILFSLDDLNRFIADRDNES